MRPLRLLSLLLVLLALPASLDAQSVMRGQLRGTVTGDGDRALIEAFVTATSVQTGASHRTYTERDGSFDFPFLPPGAYEVRAEAPGYRPRLVRTIRVRPGEVGETSLTLESTQPPVTRIDTVTSPTAVRSGAGPTSAVWLEHEDLARLPDRQRGLTDLASLATRYDPTLGSEGLPGALTQTYVDGVPFTPARHPLLLDGGFVPTALPRIGLDHVGFLGDGNDVEWSGGAGGQVAISSQEGSARPGAGAFGSGSLEPLWNSDHWRGPMVSSLQSFWGGGEAHVPLAADSSRLFVGLEGMQLETPRVSPLRGALANSLGGLEVPVEGFEAMRLSRPWSERTRSVSGLARLDWNLSPEAAVTARVSAGMQDKGDARFFGSPLAYGSTPPLEGSDLSASAGVFSELTDRISLELRAGVERSERDYEPGDDEAGGVPPTLLVRSGQRVGPDPGLAGSVRRTAFYGGPTVHYRMPEHWFKGGVVVSLPSHRYDGVHRGDGEYLFTGPDELGSGEGIFLRSGAAAPRDFLVPEMGVFLQHRWDPTPEIRVTTGARLDREFLPSGDVVPNTRWAELSGLDNTGFRDAIDKFGARLGLVWDLTGRGTSIFRGTLGAYHDQVDPGAVAEVLALDGSRTMQRVVGGLEGWPEPPDAGAGTSASLLALFGPELEAPRTARAGVGLSQRLTAGTTLHLAGVYRRTQFLLRRTDLNRPLEPSGRTDEGRPVFGSLVKEGSVLMAEAGSNRRFPEFDQVWGRTADGWSRYRGMTVALEHRTGDLVDLFASYTLSSTEDNWVGAATPVPEARLVPRLGDEAGEDWAEAPSDFDVPHRVATGLQFELPVLYGITLTGIYRYRSDRPFTPGYGAGADLNGDGSAYNDPAYVPDTEAIRELAGEWECLGAEIGRIAGRNSCRGDGGHSIDAHASIGLFRWRGATADLFADAFNLLDTRMGVRDSALFRVHPHDDLEMDAETGAVAVPLELNPDFGSVAFPLEWGRMLRVGLRMGVG